MRSLAAAVVFLFAALPVQAFEPQAIHPDARAVASRLLEMPAFDRAKVTEEDSKGLAGHSIITLGDKQAGGLTASLLVRDAKLVGLRFNIPLLPKADPGLYAFTEIAAELEPAMADLRLEGAQSRRDALKTWASEIGIESWMRPRFGAYRITRRVGNTLFVFEGAPLQGFWLALSHAGDRHPVFEDLGPYLDEAQMALARPILEAVEHGEYVHARSLLQPHAAAGQPWAQLLLADYGEPVGPGRAISQEISRLLEAAAEAGFAPALHVVGQPDSSFAERRLTKAAQAGYPPAIALKARRRYTSGDANDPAARCDELVALQGDPMAMLRTVYRYAEGGGETETAWFWGRVTLERFGEASSITVDSYILHTLGVLSQMIPPERQDILNADAAAWQPRSFDELKARYTELGCLD